MVADSNLLLFVASVIGVSLTGVMMPGPVTAVAIARGYQDKNAGAFVALGHILIEIPVLVLVYLGLTRYLSAVEARIAISLAGGLTLLWMGWGMFHTTTRAYYENEDPRYNPLVGGLVATVTNPYFFLWWATVGVALVAGAHGFGIGGVALLAVIHFLCDFGWLFLLSRAVFKSRRLWTEKVHRIVFSVCALILAGFGAWFVISGASLILKRSW